MIKYLLALYFLGISTLSIAQRMTFHYAQAGTAVAHTRFLPYAAEAASPAVCSLQTHMLNVNGRFSTSIWHRCYAHKMRKFLYGDVLWGQVGIGAIKAIELRNLNQTFFPTFDFGIGFGGIYRLNPHNDIGVELGMLRFTRSLTTFNYNGCHIRLKYRLRHVQAEAALHNWYGYYLTWLYLFSHQSNPMHYSFTFKYLINDKKMMGLHVESNILNEQKPLLSEPYKEAFIQINLFYGINF